MPKFKVNTGEVSEIAVVDSKLEITLTSGEEVKAQKELEAGLVDWPAPLNFQRRELFLRLLLQDE